MPLTTLSAAEHERSDVPDRRIVHADLDAFYASVEELDDPRLRGKPLIVGRDDGRGVVATANYEARTYGVGSAMPMTKALSLCPAATVVAPRRERYQELAAVVLSCYEPLLDEGGALETVALDEAYLDVSHLRLTDRGLTGRLAQVRSAVRTQTGGLTVSVGAARTKTVAKLASEHAKPDGLTVISADDEVAFLRNHPVSAINGIGPKTAWKLETFAQVRTVADVLRADPEEIDGLLGTHGPWLRALAADGNDGREVRGSREAKQHGASRTYDTDLTDRASMHDAIRELTQKAAARLRDDTARGRTVSLTVRLPDHTTTSRSRTLPAPISDEASISTAATALLDEDVPDAVRLLGVTVSSLTRGEDVELFPFDPAHWQAPRRSPDAGSLRTGPGAVVHHPDFGEGIIEPGGGSQQKGQVRVRFDELGATFDVPAGSLADRPVP